MPRINADTFVSYPKGVRLAKKAQTIPEGVEFVIGQAADGYWGTGINDPGSYVNPDWAQQVDAAYRAGVLIGAEVVLRVAGADYPIDYQNPDKDRQLQGFLKALENKTYAFIVLRVVSADSPAATIQAMNYFGGELRKTGKRVFLTVSKAEWEADSEMGRLLVSAIGHESFSQWSFLITGDFETEIGAAIEQPGNWTITPKRNLIWENQPGKTIMWGQKPQWSTFLGVEWPGAGVDPDPKPDPEPDPEDDPEDSGEDDSTMETLLLRIAVGIERIADAVETIRGFFGRIFQ